MKQRIAEIRRAVGISQNELAKRIDATQSMVGKLERGEREMTFGWLTRIAVALDVPTGELLDATDEPTRVGYVDSKGKVVAEDYPPGWTHEDGVTVDGVRIIEAHGAGQSGRRSVRVTENMQIQMPSGSDLIYDSPIQRPSRQNFGRLAFISLVDGSTRQGESVTFFDHYIGIVMPGSKPKCHHVLPLNGPLLEDVRIEWLALVTQINLP